MTFSTRPVRHHLPRLSPVIPKNYHVARLDKMTLPPLYKPCHVVSRRRASLYHMWQSHVNDSWFTVLLHFPDFAATSPKPSIYTSPSPLSQSPLTVKIPVPALLYVAHSFGLERYQTPVFWHFTNLLAKQLNNRHARTGVLAGCTGSMHRDGLSICIYTYIYIYLEEGTCGNPHRLERLKTSNVFFYWGIIRIHWGYFLSKSVVEAIAGARLTGVLVYSKRKGVKCAVITRMLYEVSRRERRDVK